MIASEEIIETTLKKTCTDASATEINTKIVSTILIIISLTRIRT